MRRVKLIIGAVLLLGVPVTLAAAQSSVPTVAVSVSGSNVVLDPSGPIGAGSIGGGMDPGSAAAELPPATA